jgi:hypothetical protein
MIQDMSTVRITESELSRDVHVVLEKVQQGVEVIIWTKSSAGGHHQNACDAGTEDQRMHWAGQSIWEKLGYRPVPDPDFAKDVEASIAAHREPLQPSSWD